MNVVGNDGNLSFIVQALILIRTNQLESIGTIY